MSDQDQLRKTLSSIDGRGYKAYKQIRGSYRFPLFKRFIDHVQGDPFALPSKIRIRINQDISQLPQDLWEKPIRKMALEDFIARSVRRSIKQVVTPKIGTGKSGLIFIDAGRQEVLERTAAIISKDWVEVRMQVGLPAAGRTILGNEAFIMLCREIPEIIEQAVLWENIDQEACTQFVECVENQESIKSQLDTSDIAAFVANGSVLPRQSGISDLPLTGTNVVSFQTPESLLTSFEVPNPLINGETVIHGMGIPKGITLIVGGGYHGKSTVLKALERGVYYHIPGDGREYVVTNSNSVKIRAEDGRRIENVNITPFITNLPQNTPTDSFCTEDASGSTSQAANIMEALEVGAEVLLLDEDTSATNFMVRDARMQQLVQKNQEPITPFVDRIWEVYDRIYVSTILVMGGSGDYFDVANTAIKMQDYLPYDVHDQVQDIITKFPTQRQAENPEPITRNNGRIPQSSSFDSSRGRKSVKIDVQTHDMLIYGTNRIDLRYLDQLVEKSQTRAVGHAIYYAAQSLMNPSSTLKDVVEALEDFFDKNGLDQLDPFYKKENHPGNFSRPRKFEIAATINRLRSLKTIPA